MNSEETLSLIPKCAAGIDIKRRVIELEKSDSLLWQAIEKLQNRLPIWATAIISLLTFLLGCSLTYVAILSKGP